MIWHIRRQCAGSRLAHCNVWNEELVHYEAFQRAYAQVYGWPLHRHDFSPRTPESSPSTRRYGWRVTAGTEKGWPIQSCSRGMAQKRSGKNKSFQQVRIAMYRHSLPALGNMPLGSVTKRDVNNLINKIIKDVSPVAANRVLAFIKRFVSWCRERDILEQSPAETIGRIERKNSRSCFNS